MRNAPLLSHLKSSHYSMAANPGAATADMKAMHSQLQEED